MIQTEDPILTDEVVKWVHELLPGAPPVGAYAMGMGCTACALAGVEIKRYFLSALRKSRSVEAAAAFVTDWIEAEIRKRG